MSGSGGLSVYGAESGAMVSPLPPARRTSFSRLSAMGPRMARGSSRTSSVIGSEESYRVRRKCRSRALSSRRSRQAAGKLKHVRAADLARELGVDPKRLRQWLRDNFTHEHNAPWDLTPEQEALARERFSDRRGAPSRRPAASDDHPSRPRSRDRSDEAYVIDLSDELLGRRALRQHRFSWLVGDPGKSGVRACLPVDAYYPDEALVIEYRERQHYEATPFFDRRETVSGVGRGEQRRRYDAVRERELPLHGIRLVVIRSTDLHCGRRGRLLRDRRADTTVLRGLLVPGAALRSAASPSTRCAPSRTAWGRR